jgi:hypothetical protein
MNVRSKAASELWTELTWPGRIVRATGCARFHRDGDGYGHVFRWWHPVSWLTWLVMLQVCGIVGLKVNEEVPFRLSSYWREHRDEIEWL